MNKRIRFESGALVTHLHYVAEPHVQQISPLHLLTDLEERFSCCSVHLGLREHMSKVCNQSLFLLGVEVANVLAAQNGKKDAVVAKPLFVYAARSDEWF